MYHPIYFFKNSSQDLQHIQRRAPNSIWARRTSIIKFGIGFCKTRTLEMDSPFKVRARPKSLGDLFFAKSGNPKTVSGTYFLLKFFPRFARGFIFMFFLINFVPKIPNKLKIPKIFSALRAGIYFFLFSVSNFLLGDLFFSNLNPFLTPGDFCTGEVLFLSPW